MGYDMYVCDAEGNSVKTNYEDDLYLRRSMGTQGSLRQALLDTAMGYHAATPPEFPAYPGNDHFTPEGWEPCTQAGHDYQAAMQDALVRTGDERPGIPIHKLVGNEGWWITAAECRSALQLWERAGSPHHPDLRDDVIPFLRNAAARGGFRVY